MKRRGFLKAVGAVAAAGTIKIEEEPQVKFSDEFKPYETETLGHEYVALGTGMVAVDPLDEIPCLHFDENQGRWRING